MNDSNNKDYLLPTKLLCLIGGFFSLFLPFIGIIVFPIAATKSYKIGIDDDINVKHWFIASIVGGASCLIYLLINIINLYI